MFSASSEERAFFLDVLELEDKPEEEITNNQENMDKVLASVSKNCGGHMVSDGYWVTHLDINGYLVGKY